MCHSSETSQRDLFVFPLSKAILGDQKKFWLFFDLSPFTQNVYSRSVSGFSKDTTCVCVSIRPSASLSCVILEITELIVEAVDSLIFRLPLALICTKG